MDFYGFFSRLKMENFDKTVSDTQHKSNLNQSKIDLMQDQIDHLSLVCQAMCELMEDIGFNKSMLANKIQEIDLRDGKLDGKLNKTKQCTNCNRKIAARHVRCIYCGTNVGHF